MPVNQDYTWTLVTDAAAFAARDGAGALVYDGKMWLIGGWNPGDKLHFPKICNNEVWASADGRLWVMEGVFWDVTQPLREEPNRKDVWSSEDGVHWQELPDTPWKPRHAASVFVHRDALWMVAGNNMEQDVWKLERMVQ